MDPFQREHQVAGTNLGSANLPEHQRPAGINLPDMEKGHLVEDFLYTWRGKDTIHEQMWRREVAQEEIAYLTERLYKLPYEHLKAIGAVYQTVPDESPLPGFAVRMPQFYLEQAHVQAFFYASLLTHPSLLAHYQLIEQEGFKAATGKRLNPNHLMFREGTAYTFGDFGFEPQSPDVYDGVEESTGKNIAKGGAYSWTNHSFPSLYLMGTAMPDNWGDLALARAAEVGTLAVCPLDGDTHDLRDQRARYQSARELIEKSPLIKYHPQRDYILPNGQTVAEYLPDFAKKHLALAVKPGTDIVKRYGDIIRDEGIKAVEIYDPGCTNLMLESTKALRDAFPDLVIYTGRVSGSAQNFKHVTELNKERVTLEWGIAEGQICSTSETAGGLAPKNCQGAARTVNLADEIRTKSGKDVIAVVEAGATQRLTALVALGIAGYRTTNIVSGTVEHIPNNMAWLINGKPWKPYSGEACPVTKKKGGLVDRMGNPINPEGVNGKTPLNRYYLSLAYRTFSLLVGTVKGLRFLREDNIIETLNGGRNFSDAIPMFSQRAELAAKVHHGEAGNGK